MVDLLVLEIFSGATLDERAKWFLEFDQNVLKPVLLQGNKNGENKERENSR